MTWYFLYRHGDSPMLYYVLAVLFGLALLVLALVQIYRIIKGYRKANGTPWQRFMAAFSDSATILWARITAFAGGSMTFVTTALPVIDPSTSTGQTIAALFNADTLKYWLAGITALGLLFEFVRRRPGSVDPITPPAQAKP